ncbi:MAG: penicillin-binding protein 2 [Neisseriales bacterium]|nr:MAG: penicillin-binding protein 2 [Neisseriales bacterium]
MSKLRVIVAYIFVFTGIIVLLLRYAFLQINDHKDLLTKSIENYSSIVATQPVRGGIIDRNGIVLADNRVSYAVAILPKDNNNVEELFKQLESYINLTALDKKKYSKQLRQSKNYDWVIIKDDLSNTEIANLTSHAYLFPKLNIFAHTKRDYPFSEVYSHSVGYVSRVSQTDKKKLGEQGNLQNYLANDYIGKNGLEQQYESILRGGIGKKIIRTDAHGNEVGLISNQPATDGYTLQLTIDNILQQQAYRMLGNHKGAVVAIDPQTGGILVFVSKPGYDPGLFLDGITPDDWEDLQQDDRNPLLNRAVQGTYPPGSTFKPFMSAASLYLGVRTPQYRYNDIGYFVIPGSSRRFHNSGGGRALGNLDFVTAIAKSSDAFFFKLGLDMGVDRMDKGISPFGLGSKTGIDLPQENTGLLPSRAWKAKRFAKDPYQKNWQAADSVNMGVGQGFNHYTPLQMAFATSILANDGVYYRPHLLDKVIDKTGKVVSNYHESQGEIPIPKAYLELVKSGMQKVMQIGTGASVGQGLRYTMAGKTGTAQVVALAAGSRHAKFAGEKYKDHSWFIAFAPVEKPKIAVAVLVENGGFGAAAAAPIARALFDTYLLGAESQESMIAKNYKKFTPRIDKENHGDEEEENSSEEDNGGEDETQIQD